jgi:hypothetical protein
VFLHPITAAEFSLPRSRVPGLWSGPHCQGRPIGHWATRGQHESRSSVLSAAHLGHGQRTAWRQGWDAAAWLGGGGAALWTCNDWTCFVGTRSGCVRAPPRSPCGARTVADNSHASDGPPGPSQAWRRGEGWPGDGRLLDLHSPWGSFSGLSHPAPSLFGAPRGHTGAQRTVGPPGSKGWGMFRSWGGGCSPAGPVPWEGATPAGDHRPGAGGCRRPSTPGAARCAAPPRPPPGHRAALRRSRASWQ